MMWKNNRPPNWVEVVKANVSRVGGFFNQDKPIIIKQEREIFEAGADALFEAVMKERPSNDEIKTKLIACLYGGSDVPELLEWLKEKLLVK